MLVHQRHMRPPRAPRGIPSDAEGRESVEEASPLEPAKLSWRARRMRSAELALRSELGSRRAPQRCRESLEEEPHKRARCMMWLCSTNHALRGDLSAEVCAALHLAGAWAEARLRVTSAAPASGGTHAFSVEVIAGEKDTALIVLSPRADTRERDTFSPSALCCR